MDITRLRQKDGFWWLITAVLGSVAWIVPLALESSLTDGSLTILPIIFLLLIGTIIGFLRPNRPWRWGIASVLSFPLIGLVRYSIGSPGFADQNITFESTLLISFTLLPLMMFRIALPIILCSHFGAYVKKNKTNFFNKISFTWILGLILGLLVSGIPSFLAPVYEIIYLLPYWFGGLFIAGFTMGIKFPTPVWRWGIAVGFGLPIVVILKIIIDISRDSGSHNLFPFEILIAIVIAAVSSFPGVYLGTLIRKIIEKFRIGRKSEGT